jgi:hypothetical protein
MRDDDTILLESMYTKIYEDADSYDSEGTMYKASRDLYFDGNNWSADNTPMNTEEDIPKDSIITVTDPAYEFPEGSGETIVSVNIKETPGTKLTGFDFDEDNFISLIDDNDLIRLVELESPSIDESEVEEYDGDIVRYNVYVSGTEDESVKLTVDVHTDYEPAQRGYRDSLGVPEEPDYDAGYNIDGIEITSAEDTSEYKPVKVYNHEEVEKLVVDHIQGMEAEISENLIDRNSEY